jgi:hypothetical protein
VERASITEIRSHEGWAGPLIPRRAIATQTPPQHHFYVMTRTQRSLYSRVVMKGLKQTTAFVIQFRCTAEDDLKQFPGRVEHVASGRTGTFESIEELPQLLLSLLKCACPGQSEWHVPSSEKPKIS